MPRTVSPGLRLVMVVPATTAGVALSKRTSWLAALLSASRVAGAVRSSSVSSRGRLVFGAAFRRVIAERNRSKRERNDIAVSRESRRTAGPWGRAARPGAQRVPVLGTATGDFKRILGADVRGRGPRRA